MRTRTLATLVLTAALALAACGGPGIGAVIGSGDVSVRTPDGATATSGAVPFGNGATVTAASAAVVRIAAGATLHAGSTYDGRPGPGLVDVHLEAGAELKRREGAAFDLLAGTVRIDSGPVTSRVVVFHGTTFLEVPTKNGDGVDVRARVDGDALTVEVAKGEVLLHGTGATQKELHYVTLGPGEAATAAPGSKPEKRAAGD